MVYLYTNMYEHIFYPANNISLDEIITYQWSKGQISSCTTKSSLRYFFSSDKFNILINKQIKIYFDNQATIGLVTSNKLSIYWPYSSMSLGFFRGLRFYPPSTIVIGGYLRTPSREITFLTSDK